MWCKFFPLVRPGGMALEALHNIAISNVELSGWLRTVVQERDSGLSFEVTHMSLGYSTHCTRVSGYHTAQGAPMKRFARCLRPLWSLRYR
jgi:hypothetical protein